MSNHTNDTVQSVLSLEEVKIVARRVTKDPSIEVIDYELSSFSTERLGILGCYKRLLIQVQKKDGTRRESLNLFVKAVLYESAQTAEFIIEEGLFEKESGFFNEIVPKFLENYSGDEWLPACHYESKDVIVMDDLRFQGYRMLGRFLDGSIAAAKSAMASIARFHACSILAEAQLSRDSGTTVTLKDRYPDCCRDVSYVPRGKALKWYQAGVDVATAIAEGLGYDTRKLRKAFLHVYEMVKPSKIHRNVVCHIDLWSNNLMFADNGDELFARCVLVDFQLYRYAPLMLDVLQFLHLALPPASRREHEKELVRLYHSVLMEIVARDDKTGLANFPTLDEIFSGLDDFRLYGNIMACIYYQVVMLDPSVITEFTGPNNFERFVFEDRKQFILPYMMENESYKKIIEEAVTEMAETSERLF